MSSSIESQIKQQYSKFFAQSDWVIFKSVAGYYLEVATRLRKRDIETHEAYRLLIRNAQKRLFIGVGCELLVKAFFLKHGYGINKVKSPYRSTYSFPYRFDAIQRQHFLVSETFSFSQVLDQLPRVSEFSSMPSSNRKTILRGMRIAKVFRNKEGHVATLLHHFDPMNYSDIEQALTLLYAIGFSEYLMIQFSMERNEPGLLEIRPLPEQSH
jgi:hypothetical protein